MISLIPTSCENRKCLLPFMVGTFFGPAAAHLARGLSIEELGASLSDYVHLTHQRAKINGDEILGSIVVIDDYGNAISNIKRPLFETLGWSLAETLVVIVADQELTIKFVKAYGDVAKGEYLGLFGSGEVFEVAINQGNLAKSLGLQSGDKIQVRK